MDAKPDWIDRMAADLKSAQAEIARLQAEVERLTADRRMIVSHATMGATDGSGMTVNGVSCEITRLRNELYDVVVYGAHAAHNAAIDAAAQAMQPLFRSMISRSQAAEKILALKHPAEPKA